MPIFTPEERVGTTVAGKYRIDRILAAGGMGTVFQGVHAWTHRQVAIKILHYEHARNENVVKRFLQEARASAQLKHPNVVDVLDMGEEPDGSVYLVLELLEGQTLKGRQRQGALPLDELVGYLGPVMEALAAAHAIGVVHRDLKPDNIFLADEHGAIVPKVLDFGIAKVRDGDSTETGTGVMIGTPQYMSPEQVRGERDVGPAADVWSMGVLLYACIAGRLPFQADSQAAILAKVLTERPPPLQVVAPDVLDSVAGVVDRALSASAADRYQDMGAMWLALRAALAPAVSVGQLSHGTVPNAASYEAQLEAQGAYSETPDPRDLPALATVRLDPRDLPTPPPRAAPTPTPTPAPASGDLFAPMGTPSPAPVADPGPTPYTWGTSAPAEPSSGSNTKLIAVGVGLAALLLIAGGAGFTVMLVGGDADTGAAARPAGPPPTPDPWLDPAPAPAVDENVENVPTVEAVEVGADDATEDGSDVGADDGSDDGTEDGAELANAEPAEVQPAPAAAPPRPTGTGPRRGARADEDEDGAAVRPHRPSSDATGEEPMRPRPERGSRGALILH
jgi:serine/threonine-protein kinase